MMMEKIFYSAGSQDYLTNEIENHQDRIMRLAEDQTSAGKYLLFDFSNQANVMGDANQLDVAFEVGDDDKFQGYIYLQSFDLPKERDNSLVNTAETILEESITDEEQLTHGFLCKLDRHPRTIVLLTLWNDKNSLNEWLTGAEYEKLTPFVSHTINNFNEFAKIVNPS